MPASTYRLLLILAALLAAASLVVVTLTSGVFQTISSVVAGAAIGLVATIFVQDLASREQVEMIKAVTLDAEGITPLPETFHDLKWLAFATKKPLPNNTKTIAWQLEPLTKIGGSGPRFVTYSLVVKNLLGQDVVYRATFVGSQGCVVCAISREYETTSIVTFDTSVSSAGVYFGVANLTDWASERDITLMIVGSKELETQNLESLPENAKGAFRRWYNKIEFDVTEAFNSFPGEKAHDEK